MPTVTLPTLTDVRSEALTEHLREMCKQSRLRLVEFLAYLGEIERRQFFLEMGFSSMFAFCTEHLGLEHSATFRRTNAARLLARFPVIADYLADGRLSLTTLVQLRKVLCAERLDEILSRATGRTEDEVERLVAALQPQPVPDDLLRRVPTQQPVSVGPTLVPTPPPHVSVGPTLPPAPRATSVSIDPIDATRFALRATVSEEFAADLKAVRAALSHQIPSGALAEVLHHCIRTTLDACEKRRRGAGRTPPATTDTSTDKRAIPAAMRSVVWSRDAGRCAYVAPDGHRCSSTWQLEIHHVVPYAVDHVVTVDGLSLRCRAHNVFHAIEDLGADTVAHAIAARQAELF